VLRTFALALRDAERWDDAPLVGVNVFLGDAEHRGLSEAARELTTVATTEEYEGKRQEWATILEGELAKARDLQDETTLGFRELEQAVFATFLHSQPIGQKASTRDLLLMLGATRPDRIDLEKGLRRWAEVSWFLDEAGLAHTETTGGSRPLPKTWRLGSRPNLTQMHHDACTRVSADLIDAKLLAEVGKLKALTAGVRDLGVRTHILPDKPRDVEDDGDFHFAVLGPKAASSSGNPSAEARRFLDETTGPDRPRVYRNAFVLAVPSREGLKVARTRIRDYLGWEEVQHQLKDQDVDPIRQQTLASNLDGARRKVPEAIQLMFGVVVTVSEKNEAQAFKLTVTPGEPLFAQIKADARSRIQDTAISADALLPEGPYNLWREGEVSRLVKDLVGAFAQLPHLPKMLRSKEILDTLVQGAREGFFVLRATRPDQTVQTFWRQEPPEAALKEPGLEVVLPEAAELSEIPPGLLQPAALPGLWPGDVLPIQALRDYFAGGRVAQVARQGYEESVTIPHASAGVIEAAIGRAVEASQLWLTAGTASLCGEPVPTDLLAGDAALQLPPAPIPSSDVLPAQLPQAWGGNTTTAAALAEALSAKAGKTLPWNTVCGAINGAFQAGQLERSVDSGPWSCDRAGASTVRVRLPGKMLPPPPPPPPPPGVWVAQADLRPNQLQDLADQVGELTRAAVGFDLKFSLRIELSGQKPPPVNLVERLNKLLAEVTTELRLQ
jgi:hypothetical protein